MSVNYLSFGSIAKLHSNNHLAVSTIGEMTNKARTYAKDPAVFSLDAAGSETVLYNFLSQRDGVDIALTQALAEAQIGIGDYLCDQTRIGNITSSRANTLALLQAQFSNNIAITDVGEMVTNNTYWFPSYVEGYHTVSGEQQSFTIWFSDAYFRTQYPIVSFAVVHPISLEEFDSLMTMNYQQIETRLQQETPDKIEDRTHELTDQAAWPYTERKVISFSIMDPINAPHFNTGYWRYVSWGNSVDSEDQLLEQIKAEILAASEFPESAWEEKIPDLFNALEYYVIPYFDRLGLEDRTTGARTLSPIIDRETMMELVDQYLTTNMTQDHVIKSLQIVPFLYKSIQCAFVSKVNNRVGMEKVLSQVPDYQLIHSSDSDFGQMSSATGDFILGMENLISASEVVTPDSLPPSGISRVVRFGKLYVAKRIGKAKYLVLTKWQLLQDDVITED